MRVTAHPTRKRKPAFCRFRASPACVPATRPAGPQTRWRSIAPTAHARLCGAACGLRHARPLQARCCFACASQGELSRQSRAPGTCQAGGLCGAQCPARRARLCRPACGVAARSPGCAASVAPPDAPPIPFADAHPPAVPGGLPGRTGQAVACSRPCWFGIRGFLLVGSGRKPACLAVSRSRLGRIRQDVTEQGAHAHPLKRHPGMYFCGVQGVQGVQVLRL